MQFLSYAFQCKPDFEKSQTLFCIVHPFIYSAIMVIYWATIMMGHFSTEDVTVEKYARTLIFMEFSIRRDRKWLVECITCQIQLSAGEKTRQRKRISSDDRGAMMLLF